MFAAPPGLSARYVHDEGTERQRFTYKRIIAFDDDGIPHVVAESKRQQNHLIPASHYQNFDGLTEDPYPVIVAIAPASGYWVEFTDNADGTKYSKPLVGWALRADGVILAVDVDSDGAINELEYSSSGEKFRIYHPDAKE